MADPEGRKQTGLEFESPESPSNNGESRRLAARTSFVDTFKGCGLRGYGIDKEELRKKIVMPEYLRLAVAEAGRKKKFVYDADRHGWDGVSEAPEAAIVVFVNSKSGGRCGPELKARLLELISEEQVFDLSTVKPSEFLQYGLGCLEKLASLGDHCAKDTLDRVRIVVAGGDGTVGWVLGSIGELHLESGKSIPPVGIIPLGTGNDLARSFNWGGSFPFAWKAAVKRSLYKAATGPICRLDSWQVILTTKGGEQLNLPHAFKPQQQTSHSEDVIQDGTMSDNFVSYRGLFYNYFSIGMDAQVAYGFHHLRDEKPYLARGPITNKMIYSGYSCAQGWFCTPCSSNPRVRGINNIIQIHIKRANCSDWEILRIPSSVRAIVALNLHNYASGRNPWGQPNPDYLEKRGFVEANPDDGLLEIFGLKEGWHTTFVMFELIKAKHIAQAAAIKVEVRGGQRKRSYMQMDGEPWRHPLNQEYSSMIEITRVPFPSLMISGE